jgi:hypothetical protein
VKRLLLLAMTSMTTPPRLVRVLYGLLTLLRRYRFAAGGVVDQLRHEEPGWSQCRLPLAASRRCCPCCTARASSDAMAVPPSLSPRGLIVDRPGRVCQPTRLERQPQAEVDRRERLMRNRLAQFRSRQFIRLDGRGINWFLRGREHLQLLSKDPELKKVLKRC